VRARLFVCLAALWASAATADELLMVRVERSFGETVAALEQSVPEYGLRIARVQRVDVGLHSRGYQTAEYRLVFLGGAEELEHLAARYPEALPYLPFKLVVFAEGDSTLVLALSPETLAGFYHDENLRIEMRRRERDLRAILDNLAGQP
jgi:uncharacterized protein (DUF302 family)